MVVAWSHSVLDSFETCAFRHYQIKVAKKVVEGQSAEMAEGNNVHKALENRIKLGSPLPEQYAAYEKIATRLEKAAVGGQIEAEQKMCLNQNYAPVSFFAKDAWVRAITDVTITKGANAFVGDYKTGKPKVDSSQLRLTAAVTFQTKPWINKITNTFLWLKTNTVTTEHFTRDDAPTIWREFAPKVQRLEIAYAENKWPKKPSGLCREWCPVPRHLCEHSGKS